MSLRIRSALLGLLLTAAVAHAASQGDIFPFKIHETTLDNGLKVVTIPYDSPGTVAYYLVVRTGSRDEVEPGHSGFAHFFEHMMFRGTERYPVDAYTEVMRKLGANSNASTFEDRTVYQLVGPSRELETMMDVESDRFKNLKYSEEDFRTESLAVLGEYNKSASNPLAPLFEKERDLAFQKHTYKHSAIGFLADIKAMPGYYDYSRQFFQRFYRPENVTLLVVGDAQPQRVVELAKKYYGDWKKGYQATAVQAEPPQTEPKQAHIDWPNPISPYLLVGYHAPAFSTKDMTSAAMDVIAELLFSETAPLYKEVVVDKQWADSFAPDNDPNRDPNLFSYFARAQSEDLIPKIEDAVDRNIRELQEKPVDPQRLERIKSNLRYGFAQELDTPSDIADQAAVAIGLTGDIGSINERFAQYQKVTPQDVQKAARTVFRRENETVVTLSHKAETPGSPAAIDLVTLPSESPLVAIRLLFDAGSIYDPAGKEGLASLTALMVAQGGTQKRSYSELLDALYPLAAGIDSNTDREVTLFDGTVHRETLADYSKLLEEALLQPSFAPSDFERNRQLLISSLTNSLRSNDERLGLEALQDQIFAGHPYGHPADGTVEGLKSITLDDVKAFYREHYTQASLMLGVAGGYPKVFPEELARAFAALPAGQKGRKDLPPAPKIEGRHLTLIEKQTASVGITLGHPLPINRSNPDYYPLMVANSYLGEHRTMYGLLMNQLRGQRGLNYGDYSYIEYWYNPPGTDYPTANVPRRQQYFSIWIRPVVPADAQFALRAAIYELRQLHDQGMTKEEVDTFRTLLINYSKLWAQSPAERLGFLMDS
ncbi:MAG TPA: pitrilysin family protein, partial [Thermoanaerobaculia bacterium]|nr:pitrilysin family protein [Thermoanaerobaculia bacterium]